MDINAIKVNEVVHMSGARGAPPCWRAAAGGCWVYSSRNGYPPLTAALATAAQERIINSNLPSARRSLDHSLFCSAIVI